jgi:hypothetical protein
MKGENSRPYMGRVSPENKKNEPKVPDRNTSGFDLQVII